jgi:hypothetical protein
MAGTTEVPHTAITRELQESINLDAYHCIDGSDEGNILTALFVALGTPGFAITAKQFLAVYIWLVQTLYAGIRVDFGRYPKLAGTRLWTDAYNMQHHATPNLLEPDSILRTARFVSVNDPTFMEALDTEITMWEATMLVSQFFPG